MDEAGGGLSVWSQRVGVVRGGVEHRLELPAAFGGERVAGLAFLGQAMIRRDVASPADPPVSGIGEFAVSQVKADVEHAVAACGTDHHALVKTAAELLDGMDFQASGRPGMFGAEHPASAGAAALACADSRETSCLFPSLGFFLTRHRFSGDRTHVRV
ncbi:hypothetical protein ACFWIW_29440 [Amycolatopsis sp. NPDC058340]|uniref:hypothetical protein n=1 Tax=Amycolatopsis sp. NPDC058340 TaxID=3346453 RepID=UPI0036660708